MSIRSTLLTYLASSLTTLAGAVGVPLTDAPDGVGYVLDQTLAVLGPAPTTLTPGASALVRYFALRLLLEHAAAQVDMPEAVGAGTPDPGTVVRPAAQRFRQIQTLLADAKAEAQAAGYLVAGPGVPRLQSARPRRSDPCDRSEYGRLPGWGRAWVDDPPDA